MENYKNELTNFWIDASGNVGMVIDGKMEYPEHGVTADILLTAKLKVTKSYYQLYVKIYDIMSREIILNKSFVNHNKKYRALAHELSDEIVLIFYGERGIAHSKVVFSNNRDRHKEIYVIDYDGYNLKKLTNHKSISIFPRWSPAIFPYRGII